MKEESEKVGLKLTIQKTKIMAPGLIISWQIDGEKVETVRNLIFLGSKITEDGACSHEIKRHLLLGRKAMTNQDSVLKSRDITLPTKVHIVEAMSHQAPLSMIFSRQGYWSGLPFPSPGYLPNPGIKPRFPALQADSLPTELQRKPVSH